MMVQCWKCQRAVEISEVRVGLRDTCPQCEADLHVCRNCKFHDPGKHNQCAEPQAEWVRDKESSNHCDYFSPENAPSPSRGLSPEAERARKKFDSLFKI